MFKTVFAFFISILFLLSCSQERQKASTEKSAETCDVVRYASHLKICSKDDSYTVEILDPDKQSVRFKAILGPKKPSNIAKGYTYIKTPVKNMAVLSATQIGMLSRIGMTNAVCAVSSGDYVHDASLRGNLKKKRVHDLGSESEYIPEKLIAAGTKFILYSDFGKPFPNEEKLEKMGVTCIPIPDWRELDPLGKAEWILFMGILTGTFEKADLHFKKTESHYLELKEKIKNIPNRPVVLSGNMIGDSWVAPNGNSYYARLIEDAGGSYLYSNHMGTGSTMRTIEQVLKESSTAKYWINPGYADCRGILLNNSKLKHLKLMNSGNIWCYSSNMNKYWELSACEPDLVLEDLIRIFHPEKLADGKMNYYGKVDQ